MPAISIIIPLFNKGSLIVRAIDSIFSQTFQDFEIIVVDDGSTDNGPDFVKQYKDPRLRFFQQSNSGPGAARNRGVKESSLLYLAFLDADDEWLPEFLQTSITNLRNNPDCALSVVNHLRGSDKTPIMEGIVTGSWRLHPETEPLEMWGSFIHIQQGVLVCQRDIFLKYGGFYEHHCTYGEGRYLWLQVLLNHRIFRDTTPLHWHHVEDSDLDGPNRKLPITLFPMLTDAESIRKNCPADYRLTLEKFLAFFAEINFNLMYSQHDNSYADISSTIFLLKEFPMMKDFKKDWSWLLIKLRIKVALPWLVFYMKAIKQHIQFLRSRLSAVSITVNRNSY